ncbi:centrosomal protein of 128 kDa-like [Hypomesus transpacificus]|uniref:centrosomal protein of 128 kDa-like n=1 Tax=Hypomesus transpacificus TaxID=137520 RepID=UPI001F072DE6|nr:centrosomal protein of 128 kDa-like [Hypomesus transpacificus]
MESSSESDSFQRTRGVRSRGRESRPRARRDRTETDAVISEKINTLTSTLQDTSRNLNKVDRMLGEYREHTDDQAEAMATLREDLEESILQLQSQRQRRPSRAPSASGSTLHTSDLEGGNSSEGQRFYPTSPLKDYGSSEWAGGRRRSRSATVRFCSPRQAGEDIHNLHQSLRDLRSDQIRLGGDLDTEVLRRNRSDVDTRRALENLAEHLTASQQQDLVSSRVEQRLQEMEREMRAERQSTERPPEARGSTSDELQEALRRREARVMESEEVVKIRLLSSKADKTKLEQELERARKQLDQSEGGRNTLLQQVEDLREQLLRLEQQRLEQQRLEQQRVEQQRLEQQRLEQQRVEQQRVEQQRVEQQRLEQQRLEQQRVEQQRVEQQRVEQQRVATQPSTQPRDYLARDSRAGDLGPDVLELEREVQALRGQLSRTAALRELEELKTSLERKEGDRLLLCTQVEALSSDLSRREHQQLSMLQQLKDIQARSEACAAERARAAQRAEEAEAQLEESARSREQLRARAQEAVRQWRARARRLQRELEEARAQARLDADKAKQVCEEREGSLTQVRAASQQAEGVRKELAEALSRLAQREEELHQKEVQLSETRGRRLGLEQELLEAREAGEEEAQRQARLRQENQRLEEALEAQTRRHQGDREELQAAVTELRASRAQLASRLAEEEASRRELQRASAELQVSASQAREQSASLGGRLEQERQEHQRELAGVKAAAQEGRSRLEQTEARLLEMMAAAGASQELQRALGVKLDRMKAECDKLTQQLASSQEANRILHRKYQQLKQEVDEKVRWSASEAERRRVSEEARAGLEEARAGLEERLRGVLVEQEAVLSTAGGEIDAACRALGKDAPDTLQILSGSPGLLRDPHCWLADTKAKLRWLSGEMCERGAAERRMRRQIQTRDSDRLTLLQRLEKQESKLLSLQSEKTELLEKNHRREEDMRSLQERVLELEKSTRVALNHLESVPEKLGLMDDIRDLEESHHQKQVVDECYVKYKDIVGDLQHQLEESKRKIQEYRDEKMDATSRSIRLAAMSSSIRGPSNFFHSSLRQDTSSPPLLLSSELTGSLPAESCPPVNGLSDSVST